MRWLSLVIRGAVFIVQGMVDFVRGVGQLIPPFDLKRDVLALWGPDSLQDTSLTILMGALVAVACAWLGCWLILQGLALVGDAISHTVLLGIVIAFLLTGTVTGIGMFVAATVTGVLTVVLIDALRATSRLKEDAAIGIVFTSLFALGVVLLSVFARGAHIDTQHVLYGNLDFVANEKSVTLLGINWPVPVCQMAGITVAIVLLTVAFYKELLLVAFDPQLAQSMGVPTALFRYGMLGAVSFTVVGAFSAVGAILVVAMLIVPAATAYLLTRRLPMMFAISSGVGVLSSAGGYHLGYWLKVPAASMIVCVACGLFGLAFLFAPEQGVLSALWRRLRNQLRAAQENIIRRIWKIAEGQPAVAVSARQVESELREPGWRFGRALEALRRRGWIEYQPGRRDLIALTRRGALQAQRLDRAHRLWETYLVDQVGLASDHVHPAAEVVEHVLTDQLVELLDDVLGHPDTDPHGAPIPRSTVVDQGEGLFVLAKLRAGDRGRVAGMIDVETLKQDATPVGDYYVEVARLGLTLGQPIVVLERDAASASWLVQVGTTKRVTVPHHLADAILVRLSEPGIEDVVPSRASRGDTQSPASGAASAP